jgi:hypothetical protein
MDKRKINSNEITQRIPRKSLNDMETKTIPVICPWCNSIFKMSKWEVEGTRKTGVTHGICPECMEKTLKEAGNPKELSRPSGTGSKISRGIKEPAVKKQGAADRFKKFFNLKK